MDYKIAICDDSESDRKYIARLAAQWAASAGCTGQIALFASSENFLFHYAEKNDYDILLLDIEMGAMNGMALAKKLRQENSAVQIVFITGFPDFMAEGYEVAALHYLMKPVSKEKLFQVLDRAAGNLQKAERRLRVTFDRETELVPLSKITYIEAQKQYVVIHTESGEYRMKAALSEVQKELDEYFFKCQRSFIVDLRFVQKIDSGCVTLKNGAQVPISRGMAQEIGREIIRLF